MKKSFLYLLPIVVLIVMMASHVAAQDKPKPDSLVAIVDVIPDHEISRMGRGAVLDAVWLPDGNVAVMSSQGIWLYDAQFADKSFVPDILNPAWHGNQFAALDAENTLTLWQLNADDSIQAIWSVPLVDDVGANGGSPLRMRWNEDGSRLAITDELGQILIVDSAGTLLNILYSDPVTALVWHGNSLTTGHQDGVIRILNPVSGEVLQQWAAHTGAVWSLAWNADTLASGGNDALINLWDTRAGGFAPSLRQTLSGHTERVQSLAWYGDQLASAAGHQFMGGQVRLWDTVSGQTLSIFGGTAAMQNVRWNAEGTRLLAIGDDNLVRIWNTNGQPIATLQGFMNGVEDISWNPTGVELASASDDGRIRIWHADNGQVMATLQGHSGGANAVAWSPDGRFVASAGLDDTIRVWLRESGKTRTILRGHTERVWSVDWHPNGTILASASRDETVRTWNAFTGETLRVYSGPDDEIVSVRWSPDGSRLAASSDDGSVWIWDAETGETLQTLKGHNRYVFTLDWHPTQNEIISGSWFDGTMRLWDTQDGTRLDSFDSVRVFAVAWNPSGNLLASADADGLIRIWDMASGDAVQVLSGHVGAVYALAWRPDGAVLASAGMDGTIRLWGEEIEN